MPTPTPTVSSTPTPTATTTGVSGIQPGNSGIAYVPDSGVASFNGVQVVRVEDTSGNLLPTPFPMTVPFASSVGSFDTSSDGTVAFAMLKNSSGKYTLVQSVYGINVGAIVPVGSTYDASMLPTPSPSSSPSPGATATPVPSPLPVIADVTGTAVLGSSTNSVGLLIGPSTQGFLGITSLTNAPPQFGGFAPFQGSTQTVTVANTPRTNIEALLDANGVYGAVVRGPSDLMALTISLVGSGYQFKISADDTTLGYASSLLRGYGAFAIDPADASRVLVGQANASGGANTLTLVTGLPTSLTHAASLTLPSAINTVDVIATGSYGLVGAANGFYVVSGISSGSLSYVAPSMYGAPSTLNDPNVYQIPFTACDGNKHVLTNVTSIALTADEKYVIALGSASGVTCSSGSNAAVVAVPFGLTTGVVATPSPAPTATGSATAPPAIFWQNNVVAPPAGVDVMSVH